MANTYELTWDLDSLYANPATGEFQTVLEEFTADLQSLADRSDVLPAVSTEPPTVTLWADFLGAYEDIAARATDLNAFVGCHCSTDAANKTYQQLEAALSAVDPLRERIATNLQFALHEATAETFDAFLAADEKLSANAFFLTESRQNASLRLPRDQELLAAELSVDGIHAWGRLYDRVSGELRVPLMERGELVEKSPGQVHFDSPLRDVRENNFYAADKAWSTIADTCADALNHISGTRLTHYRRLGCQDHLDVPLRRNRLQRETLETMWSAVTARKPALLKYLEAKARAMGREKPAWYDMQAAYPVTGGTNKITYDEAVAKIVSTFTEFSPEFGQFAEHACSNRWIEAEDRSGKRQGGFCTDFPTKKQTRIFMTFTNSEDSMSTLAHELGHSFHAWVLKNEPVFLQDYPMNLAETASTFAEAVLGERRLADCDSADQKIAILDNMLADSVSFLMNIHARFIFENSFHVERQNGELTADRFRELMLAAQKEAYVDGLADDGWNGNFWVSKLHFYISGLPFYNFPYTFGYLLSLGMYALAGESGGEFAGQYREFLRATGCHETEDAVQTSLGYDLTTPDFWNKSLDVVDQRVEQFLELTAG